MYRPDQRSCGDRRHAERKLRHGKAAHLAVDYHLSTVRTSGRRNHADQCLSFLLRLSSVWCEIKTEDRRLLCILQLRICTVSACSDRVTMLFLKFGPKIIQM